MFELVDLSTLGAHIMIMSAVTKVAVDALKAPLEKRKHAKQLKITAAYLIPICIAILMEDSLFATNNSVAFFIGCILTGAIAGLGSTYAHEALRALQTLKNLKAAPERTKLKK